jgi:hypothetical protein
MRKPKEIKSKIDAIKNSFVDKKTIVDDIHDRTLQDLKSTEQLYKKKFDDFLDKRKKKVENRKDIFSELINIVESFISIDNRYQNSDKYLIRQKIKQYAVESIRITLESSKQIIQDNTKSILFAGENICGANSVISTDVLSLKPKEIDFLNILTIEPSSNMGQIVYEPISPDINKQKVNRSLYTSFINSPYDFLKNDGNKLFSVNWNIPNQEFEISGLKQNTIVEVNDFLNDYYSSIEMPDITGIIKTAMLLTIQGDNTQSLQFNLGINNLERLTNRLFAICGTPTERSNLKNQNPVDLFDENEEDVEEYFDFDNLDGIDFENEDARIRGVIKFIDCNNFEIPVNNEIFEDFVYFSSKKNINDLVNETLEKVANDASEQSDNSIPISSFNINLINNFILNLPKGLVMNILSPKVFLPIVIVYKIFKFLTNQVLDVKEFMKRLSKLFSKIIKDIFWKFIREFWSRIKAELLTFVRFIVTQIIKSKYKRYVNILTAIIQSLKRLNINTINNCENLFDNILNTIEKATTIRGRINIPGLLLSNSDFLPGLSKQKLLLDTIEFLESNNINTGDIFGERNNLVKVIEGIFDSTLQNFDKYSYIKGANKDIIVPSQMGPIVIPRGLLTVVGKIF